MPDLVTTVTKSIKNCWITQLNRTSFTDNCLCYIYLYEWDADLDNISVSAVLLLSAHPFHGQLGTKAK